MLGLARRAGRIVSGEFAVTQAVKAGKACLAVLASDAAPGTQKEFRDMCSYYKVPIREYGTKEELGHAVGTENRSILALTDRSFADAVEKQLTL